MLGLMSGAIAMGAAVIAVFFLKYWTKTRDRFFIYFALAFFLESLGRIGMFYSIYDEAPLFYVTRLLSYGCILLAIWEKNRVTAENGDEAG